MDKPFLSIADDILAQAFDKYVDELDALAQLEYDEFEGEERKFSLSALGNCQRAAILNRFGLYTRRPRTIDNKRMLHERRVMHDIHEEAWKQQGIALATEVRLTNGLPDGFRGRCDAICHMHCDCASLVSTGELQNILYHAIDLADMGHIMEAHKVAQELQAHTLYVVDRKGIAPGALRYQSEFPKYSHMLQVVGYSYALYNMIGIQAIPYIYYVPAGGSGRPLAYTVDMDYDLVLSEMTTLNVMWDEFQSTGELPDVKPLMTKTVRGKEILTHDWECNPLYCGYCKWEGEGGFCCLPLESEYDKKEQG